MTKGLLTGKEPTYFWTSKFKLKLDPDLSPSYDTVFVWIKLSLPADLGLLRSAVFIKRIANAAPLAAPSMSDCTIKGVNKIAQKGEGVHRLRPKNNRRTLRSEAADQTHIQRGVANKGSRRRVARLVTLFSCGAEL